MPSFLGYGDFPGSICASVNEEIVHGIPGSRVLREGDLISIDCGAIIPDDAAQVAIGRWNTKGWHADAAITVGVGEISPEAAELSRVTEQAMWAGINAVKEGVALNDVSTAIDSFTRSQPRRYGIVRDYGGHGIGAEMHMEPFLSNYGKPGKGPRLVTGMAIAVEPMLTLGGHRTGELDDEWTVVTIDESRAAHWEHSIAITDDGPWILTAPED